jgi:hypothetical protein
MFDRNMGFFSTGSQLELFRTSNGGFNWTKIGEEVGFSQITFINALTGWKAGNNLMKKSTDGGLSWINQPLPVATSGYISRGMYHFTIINKDTIWGVGGSYQFPNLRSKAILFRTTNSGLNWSFQIPDTTIFNYYIFVYIQFVSKSIGWAYTYNGIHTINGGDTTFLSIHKINSEVPKEYKLYQNYPNPFNSMTNIKLQMLKRGFAEIKIFDITGRLIEILINKNLNTGDYLFNFNASDYSSGMYFYSLFVDGIRIDTKKLMLIK